MEPVVIVEEGDEDVEETATHGGDIAMVSHARKDTDESAALAALLTVPAPRGDRSRRTVSVDARIEPARMLRSASKVAASGEARRNARLLSELHAAEAKLDGKAVLTFSVRQQRRGRRDLQRVLRLRPLVVEKVIPEKSAAETAGSAGARPASVALSSGVLEPEDADDDGAITRAIRYEDIVSVQCPVKDRLTLLISQSSGDGKSMKKRGIFRRMRSSSGSKKQRLLVFKCEEAVDVAAEVESRRLLRLTALRLRRQFDVDAALVQTMGAITLDDVDKEEDVAEEEDDAKEEAGAEVAHGRGRSASTAPAVVARSSRRASKVLRLLRTERRVSAGTAISLIRGMLDRSTLDSSTEAGKAVAAFLEGYPNLEAEPERLETQLSMYLGRLADLILSKHRSQLDALLVNMPVLTTDSSWDLHEVTFGSVVSAVLPRIQRRLWDSLTSLYRSIDNHFDDACNVLRYYGDIADRADFAVPEDVLAIADLPSASRLLREMESLISPVDKLRVIIDSAKMLMSNFSDAGHADIGADDLVPLFTLALINSNVRQPQQNVAFIRALSSPAALLGETGYYLTILETAVSVVRHTALTDEEKKGYKIHMLDTAILGGAAPSDLSAPPLML